MPRYYNVTIDKDGGVVDFESGAKMRGTVDLDTGLTITNGTMILTGAATRIEFLDYAVLHFATSTTVTGTVNKDGGILNLFNQADLYIDSGNIEVWDGDPWGGAIRLHGSSGASYLPGEIIVDAGDGNGGGLINVRGAYSTKDDPGEIQVWDGDNTNLGIQLIGGALPSGSAQLIIKQEGTLDMEDGSQFICQADVQFGAFSTVLFNTSAVTFELVPEFKAGMNVDNDNEILWYDDGTGATYREKTKLWSMTNAVQDLNEAQYTWLITPWPITGSSDIYIRKADCAIADWIMFSEEVNLGVVHIVSVTIRTGGTGFAATLAASGKYQVAIVNNEGDVDWASPNTDDSAGTNGPANSANRDTVITVGQTFNPEGSIGKRLYVYMRNPREGGVDDGLFKILQIRVKYRFGSVDA